METLQEDVLTVVGQIEEKEFKITGILEAYREIQSSDENLRECSRDYVEGWRAWRQSQVDLVDANQHALQVFFNSKA